MGMTLNKKCGVDDSIKFVSRARRVELSRGVLWVKRNDSMRKTPVNFENFIFMHVLRYPHTMKHNISQQINCTILNHIEDL